MPKGSLNVSLKGADDIFSTEESRQEQQREQVQQIPIGELFPFKNHPFKVLDDESMQRTVESVEQYGVLSPLIARPRPEGGYEIISGHRRQHAAQLAGLDALPVIVRQMDDDAAVLLMQYSAFSLAGEVARYLNISSILAAKILREAQDGMDVILADVNQYNAVLDDIIIPTIFHALFDVTAIQKTEDRDVVLLREPKDAAYYEFSAKDDLVITNKYPGFTPDEVLKSFHADTYCFDSLPEKECFFQYIKSDKVQEVYFTGMFTSNQGDLSVYYYDPESGRIRQYYPDFLAKMKDGTYQLIEVKGDNKIDDVVVQAKKEAALEMAAASGIKYEMYAGSTIMKTHVLESPPVNQTRLLP